MVTELDCGTGTPVNTVLRKYTWGRDLSGVGILPANLESAGGIGGLLAVEDTNATTTTTDDQSLAFLYDANGNVGQVVDWAQTTASAALKAKYEYDVYGNVTASGGSYATANPFRFSTKYWDDETGLGYWGYRYYEPRMGRWHGRDILQELDSPVLYCFVSNAPTTHVDSIGLCKFSTCASVYQAMAKQCEVSCGMSGICYDICLDNANKQRVACSSASACGQATPVLPNPRTCAVYGCEKYTGGASLQCFCLLSTSNPWNDFVRACLACAHEQGCPTELSHDECYSIGDDRKLPGKSYFDLISTMFACRGWY
ncbi:MAG: RHS repeat-associated core domain-containing protein [Phycisphaerae bacterium]